MTIPRELSTSCDRCWGTDQRGCESGLMFRPCRHTEVCAGRCVYAGPCPCICHTDPVTRFVILYPRDLDVMQLRQQGAGRITQVAAGLYLQALHKLQGSTTERLPAAHRVRVEVTLLPPDDGGRHTTDRTRRALTVVNEPDLPEAPVQPGE